MGGSINDDILTRDSSSSTMDLKTAQSNNNVVPKEGGLHTCPQCPRVFRFSRNLSMHLQAHSSERPVSCPCCSQMFKKSHHLDRHIAFRHLVQNSREELGKEKSGGSESGTSKAVKALNFKNSKTVKTDKFVCPLCGYQSHSNGRLSLHMKMSHKAVEEDQGIGRYRGPGRPRKLTFENPPLTTDNQEQIKGSFMGSNDGVKGEVSLEGAYALIGPAEETEGYLIEVEYSSKFGKIGRKCSVRDKMLERWSTTAETVPVVQCEQKTKPTLPEYQGK